LKIEKDGSPEKIAIHLIGDFRSDHLEELQKQVEDDHLQIVLDLKEIGLVDLEVVRFFVACVAKGMKIVHCPRYIEKWLLLETET
jgi:hypothetical protein